MFSPYVIQAVHVLLELDKVRHKQIGLRCTDFQIESKMQRPALRRVLLRLVQTQYITMSPSRLYRATKTPDEVSMLDLIKLFHGNVCIGEAFDHYISIGIERLPTDEYWKLIKFETKIKKVIEQQLEAVCINKFYTE